ncbi:hypothetical protein Raf01_79190 [Rugosimonospora africana]|uniref:Uncharacterized protein n=1 Tax=Rugosimonospora africana TaxID=556532 RepID=A0A8J3R0U9_9ACTN|nr:hypothetical protein Raf01_79190 [Rugosimonospora africana]
MERAPGRWTASEADEATATGRVPSCRWCGVPVVRDGSGEWTHTSGAYACRDGLGWCPKQYAQPQRARVIPPTGRRSI